ncbi:dTDP-4-dehydrorhamnose reductase [uncultured Succinatimonas sp.]|uniref:dTDP-4-dehydrorhamnose reductase n=1 Tax=uncultured Succinatimonas sp. TaxID=1262973 RepID=UPI0025E35BEC|nr:dTDP-4-dehydrorhamnose reductase [uncultured Succinatimonas sp.]
MLLVTGINGQLGCEMSRILRDAIFVSRNDLDISNEKQVSSFVKSHNVDCILNCAAYTAVDAAEDNVSEAELVNTVGPQNLSKYCSKIIHISTDYVFDGKGYQPYSPGDKTNPLSVYGKTKLAGEQAVLENSSEAVIIRTSWLYSSYGKNFVKTIRELAKTKKQIRVISDQIGSPTYAADLARAIAQIIPNVSKNKKGIYHYSNEGICSWYDFAYEIVEQSNLDCEVIPILSSEYPTKAIRPFYSVLSKEKIKKVFNIEIPHWRSSLRTCLSLF